MATFEELMQKFVNSDYDVLLGLGKEAVSRVLPKCKAVDADNNGFYMLSSIVLSAIAADGYLTALEKKLLNEVLGLDEETTQKFIQMYDSRMVELTDTFCDNLDTDTKADVIMLVTIVASVDEKISREETAFIKKLFA